MNLPQTHTNSDSVQPSVVHSDDLGWLTAELYRLAREMRDMTNSDPKEDKPATRKNPADNAYRSEVQDEAHKLIESASRLRRAAELYYRRQNAISWARDHREDDS